MKSSLCFFKESGEHIGELRLWNCEKKEAARSRSGSEEQEKVSSARWVTPHLQMYSQSLGIHSPRLAMGLPHSLLDLPCAL